MNWGSWLLWGFIATLALTTLLSGSQGLGLTRMSFPYLIGSIFTPDHDRARVYGFFVHFLNGWFFSLIYVLVFQSLGEASWWVGALLGVGQALFMLVVVMALMPGVHPRMASEAHGPTASRMLEPPGFLALNYGFSTPLSMVLSHVVFGIILGVFYHLR